MTTQRPLHFDWAATAPLRDEARAALLEHLDARFANASSAHAAGRRARDALTAARRAFGERLGAGRDEVVFAGNGSEANLLAVVGAARALARDRRHVLVSPIEHPSVLEPLEQLAADGSIELERLPVAVDGTVAPSSLAARLRPSTGLVSVMLANHEIGTIEPIDPLAALARSRGALFHTDACQAAGRIAIDFGRLGADLLTCAAHKFGGPRGCGILLRRNGVALSSPLAAGRQEHGLRGGTEDVASVAAAAAALAAADSERESVAPHLRRLAVRLAEGILAAFPDANLHSTAENSVAGLVNLSLADVEGDWLVAALDQRGVAVSHGAACSSLAAIPSHVLVAIGAKERARNSLRISMGRSTSERDVDELLARFADAVAAIRGARFFSSSQDRAKP
jgi:cysteine desulfurase